MESFYSALTSSTRNSFPWKAIWKSKAPNRVTFFAWEASREAILTEDNLRARKRIYVNWCYMYKKDESVNHLLLHCPVAWELWNSLFLLINVSWVMPRSIIELFRGWSIFSEEGETIFGIPLL